MRYVTMSMMWLVVAAPLNAEARPPKAARSAATAADRCLKRGDRECAIDELSRAFQISGDPAYLLRMAAVEKEMGRFEAAWKHLDQALGHPETKGRLLKRVTAMLEELEPWHTGFERQKKAAALARARAEEEARRRATEAEAREAAERQRLLRARQREAQRRRERAEAARRARAERRRMRAAEISDRRRARTRVAWLTIAGGSLVAGAGGLLYARQSDAREKLDVERGTPDSSGQHVGMDDAEYQRRRDELSRDATVAAATMLGGAAVVGAGVYLLATRPSAPRIALLPASGGGWLLLRGEF